MDQESDLICGNLRAEDDLMHPPTADPSFNESMFFNFFDDRQRMGGFVRIGNRLNEGHAEMTFCVFLPTGELLMQWGRPAISSNDSFDAGGMRFRVIEPGRRLEVTYAADVVRLADPYEMREPGHAMRGNPSCPVRMNLRITGTGPMIGDAQGSPESVIFLDGVGHYQQPIGVAGELLAGEDRWTLDAHGVRDHSWGQRIWHSIYRDRSLWISFGPELTIIACKTWLSSDGQPDEMGCLVEHGRVTRLRNISMQSRFKPDSFYHDAVRLEVTDVEGRELVLDGRVIGYVPLRHRKEGKETVYLGQAITDFSMGDRSALGLSEYFDAASATAPLVEASLHGRAVVE
jgi:hypothetical protein